MMRTIVTSTFAALLALASANAAAWHFNNQYYTETHQTQNNDGSVTQGSSTSAGTVSGATTVGTGSASTYGIANGSASSTGNVSSYPTYASVRGTTDVAGHTESGTYVSGAGAAGSVAGVEAEAGVVGSASFDKGSHQHSCSTYYGCGGGYNYQTDLSGETEILAGSAGEAYSATGSIGPGGGLAVNGFTAYGDAAAKADVDQGYRGGYSTDADVETASGAATYTLEVGNAIGSTSAAGWGFGSAEAFMAQ